MNHLTTYENQESSYLRAYKAPNQARNTPNRRNIPNSATPPNKPPILPKLSTICDLIMQNKANFLKSQMNVKKVLTKDYAIRTLSQRGKNKANSNPNKANLLKAKMNVNFYSTKDYENIANWTLFENKPNTKPIQTQTKPISNAKNNPAGSKKKGLFGVASIIRENKMLTESVFGEIMKFSLLMKVFEVFARIRKDKNYEKVSNNFSLAGNICCCFWFGLPKRAPCRRRERAT